MNPNVFLPQTSLNALCRGLGGTLLLLLLVAAPAQAQVCTGDITLSSQADVNAFDCTEVTGYLFIPGSDITDLSPLSGLISVGGFLAITDNDQLTSLDGLENVASVGDHLNIYDNSQLTSLTGLDGITSVGGNLHIYNNSQLISLDGLENVASVGGFLFISGNDNLSACSCGLAGLISDGAFTGVQGSVTISNNSPAGLCTSPTVVLAHPCGLGSITVAQTDPVPVNTEISASASFTGTATGATWNWGDDSSSDGTVTPSDGGGTVSGTHTYTAAGIYTVRLTLSDGTDADEASYNYVVIYAPAAGFVTGGGWINSPKGAYMGDPELTGKAQFGFVSKYKKGKSTPEGTTHFQFTAASFAFESTSYDWLVIAGARAKFKGSGLINGAGDYGFLLMAVDGALLGSGDDLFRIKIWDKSNHDELVYDNELNASETEDPTTKLGGGSIVIHSAEGKTARLEADGASDLAAAVRETAAVPTEFALAAAYPNPFNPATEIGFSLPEAVHVRLVVYDVLGREVARLLDAEMAAGRHTVHFEASHLPSGTYLYRIEAGPFSQSRTVVLMK